MKHRNTFTTLLSLISGSSALAQGQFGDPFHPTHHWVWCENTGWTNWRWDPAPYGNPDVAPSFGSQWLGRFVWSENLGWITLGDGAPGTPFGYTNASGADAGVNVQPTPPYLLEGLAWSENTGWINFGPFASLPAAQRARLDLGAGARLRGYAWGENIGWVNLDDATHFVSINCYSDCDEDGSLTIDDFICYQTFFALGDPYADCDGDAFLTIDDFICYQTYFAIGC